MESKKINQLATELTPALSDLTIIGDPTTGISKKITLSQMASLFTGTVEEYASVSAFPLVGVADTIYIALDTNVLYRWDTTLTSYVELSPNIINSLVFSDANGFDGTISLVGSVATLTITTALTTGSVAFIGASGALLQDNANFFWDDTNNRLGLGTNAPTTAIDVFGSGIIGRLNGTSTNNSFLGFASAGSNKWSIGNVQSDHRFRIYNEATTSELVSVLSTGEFGIGIANPTTKLHIDGGASALIANLDANVSVAKSISFRSDNSARINLEVSGTESGSNAGANFFIRRYSDAGSLIDTPLTITRSTGAATFSNNITALSITTSAYSYLYGLRISGNDITNTIYSGAASMGITADSGYSIFLGQVGSTTIGLNINTTTGLATFGNTITGTQGNFALGTSGGVIGSVKNLTVSNSAGNVGDWAGLNFAYYNNTTNFGYIGTVLTSGASNSAADLVFGVKSSNSATSVTEYMRIKYGGLVGIGTSDVDAQFKVFSNDATNLILATTTKSAVNIVAQKQGVGYTPLQIDAENQQFIISGTNRLNITSGGTVVAGSTLNVPTGGELGAWLWIPSQNRAYFSGTGAAAAGFNRFNNTGDVLAINYNGTGVGSISTNGSTTSFNTTSDYRLKEDLQETKGLEKVLGIKIYNFKYKNSENRMDGVLAHELKDILTYAVQGEKDAEEMQSVDYSKLTPILIKAIQEQQVQIEELKAK